MRQVVEHTASGIYQRSFSRLARDYGWDDSLIIEIDEDDGRSGTDTTKRKGFQWLRQQVFEGQVGAIFCWDASRLARDNADFAQLIKLCGACDTLIIDEKGSYDANNLHDNVYLGFMGVISYAESRRIGEKVEATKRAKAETGKLRLRPPTGYVYDNKGKLVLDKSKKVRDAFHLFFSTFDEKRSAHKLVKRFNRENIKFPTRKRVRGKKSKLIWGELDLTRALDILHNPTYAGDYVYGKTKGTDEMLAPDATEKKKKIVKVSLDSDAVVIIHGAHEGYITREKFIENQKILESNRYGPDDRFKGPVREGSALLSRLVVCGTCGWRLTTHYDGSDGSGVYECMKMPKHFGKFKCLKITVRRLDETVTDALLQAVNPAQLMRELEEVNKETHGDDGHEQELKKARAACEKARRRFEAIDPSHKLLIKEYGEKLLERMCEVKKLEKKYAKASKASGQALTKEELESLSALPQALRRFWESTDVTNAERKQVLRCLIDKITIKRREDSKYLDVIVHWVTGAMTSHTIVANGNCLHPKAVELMRRLAPDHTVPQIISELHEAGFKSKGGKEFSRDAIYQAFKAYGIKYACPEISMNGDGPRGDGRYSSAAVARMLNLSRQTIYRWCDLGILDGIRNEAQKGNYWIKITPEQVSELKNRSVKRMDKSAVAKFRIT
jgi:DNA invertase Pin-like site-specific DNA recombinase